MTFWQHIASYLEKGNDLALLYVLQSIGSSPGRQGFKLMVTRQGEMHGTIGGGIMEQKLVELAKSKLEEGGFQPFVKRQIHKPDVDKNRSGMICDGEQVVAFYHLTPDDKPVIDQIRHNPDGSAVFDQTGVIAGKGNPGNERYQLEALTEAKWKLTEDLSFQETAYIFGGGHVGTSMCRTMAHLGFRVVLFDDREQLYTMEQNPYPHEKKIIDYKHSEKYVSEGPQSYVIIMTFGYQPDEVVIRRLLGMDFRYIGLMGSRSKIEAMWENLRKDGYPEEYLERVHTPIGLPINSKTTDEIAISVAAEIIKVKNS